MVGRRAARSRKGPKPMTLEIPEREVPVSTEAKKARLPELSYLNVCFTLMVICVHALSEPVTSLDKSSLQYFVVYSPWKLFQFVTQAFVFLSGVKLFYGSREIKSVPRFYFLRLRRVLVPYLVWVCIYYAYFIFIGWYGFSPYALLHYIACGDLASHFYFVIIITQMYLLTPLLKRLFRSVSPWLCTLYALFISILFGEHLPQLLSLISPSLSFAYNDRLFTTYLFYFVAGAAVGENYNAVISALRRSRGLVYTAFFAFAALDLSLSYLMSCGRIYFGCAYVLHFAYSVSAIAATLCASSAFAQKHETLPHAIKLADSSSYMLYLSHILVIFAGRFYIVDRISSDIGVRLVITLAILALYITVSVAVWSFIKKRARRTRT